MIIADDLMMDSWALIFCASLELYNYLIVDPLCSIVALLAETVYYYWRIFYFFTSIENSRFILRRKSIKVLQKYDFDFVFCLRHEASVVLRTRIRNSATSGTCDTLVAQAIIYIVLFIFLSRPRLR